MIGAALLFVMAAQSVAPPSAGLHAVYGLGLRSCGEWSRDRRADGWESAVKVSWLGGYLSGLSSALQVTGHQPLLHGTDMGGAIMWLDNHCAANPLDSISTAAEKLATELLVRAQSR